MLIAAKILSILLLLLVLVEDLKYRAVHLWVFPLLLVSFMVLKLQDSSFATVLTESAFNLALIIFNLILLTAYFSIKFKKPTLITRSLIGWGDILFFGCMIPLFSFRQFVLVFPLSVAFSLIAFLLLSVSKKQADLKVPFAGFQALFVLALIGLDYLGEVSIKGYDLISLA